MKKISERGALPKKNQTLNSFGGSEGGAVSAGSVAAGSAAVSSFFLRTLRFFFSSGYGSNQATLDCGTTRHSWRFRPVMRMEPSAASSKSRASSFAALRVWLAVGVYRVAGIGVLKVAIFSFIGIQFQQRERVVAILLLLQKRGEPCLAATPLFVWRTRWR